MGLQLPWRRKPRRDALPSAADVTPAASAATAAALAAARDIITAAQAALPEGASPLVLAHHLLMADACAHAGLICSKAAAAGRVPLESDIDASVAVFREFLTGLLTLERQAGG
jgi:hypothetical protein